MVIDLQSYVWSEKVIKGGTAAHYCEFYCIGRTAWCQNYLFKLIINLSRQNSSNLPNILLKTHRSVITYF